MCATWWTDVLREQGMPRDEIGAILATRDPVVVRRHLELHRERLDEELATHQQVLERIERWLTVRPAPHERADAGRAPLVHGLRR